MINYQAPGTLIAHHQIAWDTFIILVHTGSTTQPWCTSRYENGATERGPGEYRTKHSDALNDFTQKILTSKVEGYYDTKLFLDQLGEQT